MRNPLLLLAVSSVVATLAPEVQAITPTGFMPGVENTISQGYNSLVGVWIPAISFVALVGVCLNCYFGWVRVPAKALGLLLGVFGLGAGLPWLSQISGGTIATSFGL